MLEGQTILVTGATGGIGEAIVESLAASGAVPIIHFSRGKAQAEALMHRIEGRGFVVQADLSTSSGARDLWQKARVVAGDIHGLVNNAGIRTEVTVDADPDEWDEVWKREFQINFFSAADLCKEAILHFRERGDGRIINIASRAGLRGYVGNAMPYGASKAAILNLTKSIARSFGPEGITAIAVAPGWVRTEMVQPLIDRAGEEAAVADIPIGRMAAPAEIGELVAFLMRSSQASLNGATIDVNGGSYIR